MFCILLCFPFSKFALTFLTLIKSQNVRHDAAGNRFDLVLGDVGVVDELFFLLKCCPPYKIYEGAISLFLLVQ